MIQIDDLRLAAALLCHPSLSAAARALDVTPPSLSMRLRKLEATLGLSLAKRTARRLSLTSEGERFGREAEALLGRIGDLRDSLQRDDQRLSGTLLLAAPFGYGRQRIAPWLARFSHEHPALRIQLDLRETPWPDRHDADAVIHIGAVQDSSWIAWTLASNERWLCASPAYLVRHGVPKTPRDLPYHTCVCIRENEEDATLWHVRPTPSGGTRRTETVRIAPTFTTNDGSVARKWAELDLGLVLRSQWDAAEAISQGTLVRVMSDWDFGNAPVMLLAPSRKGSSARLQALVSFLRLRTRDPVADQGKRCRRPHDVASASAQD